MELLLRYGRVLKACWRECDKSSRSLRTPLERQFLPAALELIETPPPALPRAIMWTILAAAAFTLSWAYLGQVDVVAIAPGKVVAVGKTKVIQPAETAVIKRIHVTDGQKVKEGQVLIELEAAATVTTAETGRIREALTSARLESARYDALARAAAGTDALAPLAAPPGTPQSVAFSESRAMRSQYREHRARLSALDAEIVKRSAEHASARELAAKLFQTLPIAKRRAEDYRNLVEQNFISHHGYLDREQERIEKERELAFHEAKAVELSAAVDESRRRRDSVVAEFERAAVNAKLDADKRAAILEQDLLKATARERQQTLISPVDGVVQQLAVHTIGGVVTPAQPLMMITPANYQAEVEAVLDNKDVGFVKVGQRAEIKVETFQFTRYGTLPGTVNYVSVDAVPDAKRGGLVFPVRVQLDKATLQIDKRELAVGAGMAVSVEIAVGQRRAIEFFVDPIRATSSQSFRER